MREAERARALAYAPYSGFAVGAALRTSGGLVIRGCNVENASSGLTVCAERNALFAAVAAGEREFDAIAIAGPPGAGAPPCGACRQVLIELAPDLVVYFRDAKGRVIERTLEQLLPDSFALGKRVRR
jgi:cytidine deaminase